jgi:N-methylhydantoinase A/oxoprolinase/acetone carboxylase beta subunit
MEALVSQSWEKAKNGSQKHFLDFGFRTPAVLVGIGAPIHIFLPDVARALNTKSVIPENAGVANALGAVLGNITATCEIVVKPQYSIDGIGGYLVFGKSRNSHVFDKDEAIEIGRNEAETAAREEAARRGASGNVAVSSRVIMRAAEASDKSEVLLEIRVIATAVGRIALELPHPAAISSF